LEELGELAESPLRKALAGDPSLEVRHRVERLLDNLTGQVRRMSKGEASCTVARGSDGTGGGGVFLGIKLAMAPWGFRIKRWCTSRGPVEGHLGKIG
jgi:hypothetical protein